MSWSVIRRCRHGCGIAGNVGSGPAVTVNQPADYKESNNDGG